MDKKNITIEIDYKSWLRLLLLANDNEQTPEEYLSDSVSDMIGNYDDLVEEAFKKIK